MCAFMLGKGMIEILFEHVRFALKIRKQPRRRRQQKPHKFVYLTMKNSILHALHVQFSSFDIL